MGFIIVVSVGVMASALGFANTYAWKGLWASRTVMVLYVVILYTAYFFAETIFHDVYPDAPNSSGWGHYYGLGLSDIVYLLEQGPQPLVNSLLFSVVGLPFGVMLGELYNWFKRFQTLNETA